MTDTATLNRLTMVLREVFDNDNLVATENLTANHVEGWDSLGNIRLFIEIERTFGVRFSAIEISILKDVGQLAQLIEKKLKSL